jgi:hypothetical protein
MLSTKTCYVRVFDVSMSLNTVLVRPAEWSTAAESARRHLDGRCLFNHHAELLATPPTEPTSLDGASDRQACQARTKMHTSDTCTRVVHLDKRWSTVDVGSGGGMPKKAATEAKRRGACSTNEGQRLAPSTLTGAEAGVKSERAWHR